MTIRPQLFTDWAASTSTGIAQPLDAERGSGWHTGEAPPATYFNWLDNLNSQWARYFDWRTSLGPVVDEHFVRGGVQAQGNATLLGFGWWASGCTGFLVGDYYRLAVKSATCASIGTFIGPRDGSVNLALDRDFRMDCLLTTNAGFKDAAGATGFMYAGFPSGMCFMFTGTTGNWGLYFLGTGMAAATSLAFTGYPEWANVASGGEQLKHLVLERHGPTMTAYYNEVLVGTLPALDLPLNVQEFGAGIWTLTAPNSTTDLHVDWLAFYRAPY